MKISKTLIDKSNITNAELILFSASLDGSLVVMIKEVIDTASISFKKEIRFVEILDFENNSIKVVVLDKNIDSFTGIYFRGNGNFFITNMYAGKIIEFNRSGEIINDNHELFEAYLSHGGGFGYTLKDFIISFSKNDILLLDVESLRFTSITDLIINKINWDYYVVEWWIEWQDDWDTYYTNRSNIFGYRYYSKDNEESSIVIFKINGFNDVEFIYKTIVQNAVFRCYLNEENDELIYESRQNPWDDHVFKIVKVSDSISQSKISDFEDNCTRGNNFLGVEYFSSKFLITRAFNTYENYYDLLIFNRIDFRLLKTIVIGENKYDIDGNPKPTPRYDKGYHNIGKNHIFYIKDSKLNVLSFEDLED